MKMSFEKDELLKSLAKTIASVIDLHSLTRILLKIICSHLGIANGIFIVFRKGEPFMVRGLHDDEHPYITLRDEEFALVQQIQSIVITATLKEGQLKEILQREKFSFIVPLLHKYESVGLLLLGGKSSAEGFSPLEIDVFSLVAPQIALALHNAIQVEEIKQFNDTLKDEINKATADLQKANEHLLQLDKLKDEFVAVVSHQLRTPMANIKSHLYLVVNRDSTLSERTREHLIKSLTATVGLIQLVNDMLDISRIEGGRMELHMIKVDIVALAQALIREFQIAAEKKQITLNSTDQTPLFIQADKEKLIQVFINLIDNAIKYTPEQGRVTISFNEEKDTIVANITDTGVGIAPEDIPKLFTKFGRIDNSLSSISEVPGTGLGLYVSKKIVEMSQGTISVSSNVGEGSTFSVRLPKAE